MSIDTFSDAGKTRRIFLLTFVVTALIKLVAAAFVPLTGDEAYFVLWGRHPDYGYYDHGAMTGWWLAVMLQVSDAPGWLRLPAVAVPLAVAWWLRRALQPLGEAKGNLAATLLLLSPVNMVNFFFTTDTPMLAFLVLAGATAITADRRQSLPVWLLAGFWLGLGFLSKYFAVLMGLAWAVWLLTGPGRPRWGALAAVLIGAGPGIAVNVIWNHHHGWTNIVFNTVTRNDDAGFTPTGPLIYLLLWMVLLGPALVPLIAGGLRMHGWNEGWQRLRAAAGRGPLLMAAVPSAVFAVVSLFQDVGSHWLMAFIPWATITVTAAAPVDRIARVLKPAVVYAGFQTILITIAVLAPTHWLEGSRNHTSAVIGVHTDEIIAQLEPYSTDYILSSESYSRASLLAHHLGTHVPVIGIGSHHGRQDDLLTDFRTLDGRNLMFFTHRTGYEDMARGWFDVLETRDITVRGAKFKLLLGQGFRYEAYRESVLKPAAARFYVMPTWLARFSPPADFVVRYQLTPSP